MCEWSMIGTGTLHAIFSLFHYKPIIEKMPFGTINHGRQIMRERWWRKHEPLAVIISWGVVAIIIVMFWAAMLNRLVQQYVH